MVFHVILRGKVLGSSENTAIYDWIHLSKIVKVITDTFTEWVKFQHISGMYGLLNFDNSTDDFNGYGSFVVVEGNYLRCTRILNNSGDMGTWSIKYIPQDTFTIDMCVAMSLN